MCVIYYNLYVNWCLTHTLRLNYLHAVDVDPAHAAAAVDEEDEFSVHLPQVGADGLEVRAEVQHDHGVVEDVLMEPPVNHVHLERHGNQRKEHSLEGI